MTDQWAKLFCAAVLLAAVWGAATAQQAREPNSEVPTLETIDKRLATVEKVVADIAKAEASGTPMAIGARLDRLENRMTRIESESMRYRPGAPAVGSLSMLESRLRSLESEVARLRR